ncbi:hypothetical protein [Streptomyces hainanensis]|uniref:Uncharacterized protein n=1 Tax=Streptomyces hainanensis TaxID=402648 RepID=A0A4R4TDS0_9ACTN|nr:hypothetical protein [Streptomyces hainanensis]TDC72459.1 hypothetical protein E1283_21650 [Streptomyces hainanensis]
MTYPPRLALAESGEAGDLAAYLGRQLRWDRAAAARLQADGEVVAVFTRPARFDVLAVRPCRLREPATLDVTVSAGELLESIDTDAADAPTVAVPGQVTGPSWAGLLPPRGGWRVEAELPAERVRGAAAAVVGEFRERRERLTPEQSTREALDALAEEIWSRPLPGTPLPLRAVHAAHALGMLRAAEPVAVLSRGAWLRLRTPLGSTAVRRRDAGAPGLGLSVTPL